MEDTPPNGHEAFERDSIDAEVTEAIYAHFSDVHNSTSLLDLVMMNQLFFLISLSVLASRVSIGFSFRCVDAVELE